MHSGKSIFINPFTIFGFQKIFGEEPNKELIDFLNELLRDQNVAIKNLTFKKTEHLGVSDIDRKVFEIAEYHNLTKEDRQAYEENLKYYHDLKNSLDTVDQEGFIRAESQDKPILEQAMQQKGYKLAIASFTLTRFPSLNAII